MSPEPGRPRKGARSNAVYVVVKVTKKVIKRSSWLDMIVLEDLSCTDLKIQCLGTYSFPITVLFCESSVIRDCEVCWKLIVTLFFVI